MEAFLPTVLGGSTSMRHNALRDTEAVIMREVYRDVKIEPEENPAVLRPDIYQHYQRCHGHMDYGIALRDLTVLSELHTIAPSLTRTRVWPSYMLRMNGRRTHFTQIELNKSKKVSSRPRHDIQHVWWYGERL